MLAVGSITWPHFGHFKVNNLATSRSTTWPPFFEPIKTGIFKFFSAQFSGGGAKLLFKKLFWSKKEVSKKKSCELFCCGIEGLVGCCCMMLLDALEGCSKTPINIGFLSTLLLDAEETEKQ